MRTYSSVTFPRLSPLPSTTAIAMTKPPPLVVAPFFSASGEESPRTGDVLTKSLTERRLRPRPPFVGLVGLAAAALVALPAAAEGPLPPGVVAACAPPAELASAPSAPLLFALGLCAVVALACGLVVPRLPGTSRLSPRSASRWGLGLGAAALGGAITFVLAAPTGAPDRVAWVKVADEAAAVARFDAVLARAKAEGRPAMIDFFAEWCLACKELDEHTFPDRAVRAESARFVAVKVDATEDTAGLMALQERYGVVGLPTVVFVDGRGRTCLEPRVTGFEEPADFLARMRRVF